MTRILVLGSGQLGLMLAEAAARLGIEIERYDADSNELLYGTSSHRFALPADWDRSNYDFVVAEKEHFAPRQLEPWSAHTGFHQFEAIGSLADRRSQKALLDRLDVATAEWTEVNGVEDLARLQSSCASDLIVKAASGGYDGRGQWRIPAGTAAAMPTGLGGPAIAERRVDFRRELSLVGARAGDGSLAFYPLVENHHVDGMLRCTIAPARTDTARQEEAEAMLGRIMGDLDYVGIMAMECFDENGQLLVNELAPRVHNSGHWSQLGSSVDQFELHLRALCGWSLGPPQTRGVTAMLNLIGEPFEDHWLDGGLARCHWYGKAPRPNRKLGHLNVNATDAVRLADSLRALPIAEGSDLQATVAAALAILERDD